MRNPMLLKRTAFAIFSMILAFSFSPLTITTIAQAQEGKKTTKKNASSNRSEKHEHEEGREGQHPDGTGHKDDEESHGHKNGENKEHDHEHGEEEEAKNVGPEKGITSYDEENGFTLSKEASKNFSIETIILNGTGSWAISSSALLLTGEEKSVYRVRKGSFKRIDVQVLNKNKVQAVIRSEELRGGDAVVTKGVGFLRIAEVDVTSGESGHHH